MDRLGNIFHAKLLEYSHWFMPISISQHKDHFISVDQSIYATSISENYPDTATIKKI